MTPPQGAFYVLAGHPELGAEALADRLVERAAVATVPITAFYAHPAGAPPLVRLTFAKREETLEAALETLRGAL